MFKWLLLYLLLLFSRGLFSQATIGLPEIRQYTKQVYRGGAQTRQVAQDKAGLLYFANDEGVLKFDGARWKLYPLPNKSLVRSVKFGPDGQLYVGGQDELGFFSPSPTGDLQYHSLKDRLPANARSFADVWEICFAGNNIFFQTTDRIYRLSPTNVDVYADSHWRYMGQTENEVIAQSGQKGLLVYRNGAWAPFAEPRRSDLPPDFFATSVTRLNKDTVLLTTLKSGVYLLGKGTVRRWHTPVLTGIAGSNISSSSLVNDEQIALGTNLDGCYIINRKGELVQHFGRREGLQDNSILTIFLDQQKNLWLGLHNGIDFIPYNNAVTHLNAGALNEGAGFCSRIFQNRLYLATSIGLFTLSLQDERELSTVRTMAQTVANTTGEAWNLSEVNGNLLMGHNEGAFLVRGNEAVPIDQSTGYWSFQSLPGDPSTVVAGSYRGIEFFEATANGYRKAAKAAPIESARFVVTAFNKIWFSHPYKGIYAVTPGGTKPYKKYGPQEGVISVNNNYLFLIKGQLVLTTEEGVLVYNVQKDKFEPSAFYNRYLPKLPVRYLKEDGQGNVWMVFEKKVAVLDLSGSTPKVIDFPELANKFVAGFEHINLIDPYNVLIGGEKGFYHINYSRYKALKYPLRVLVTGVYGLSQSDTVLFGGYGASVQEGNVIPQKANAFGHRLNSLRFEFASPVYGQLSNIEYSYFLEGFDNGWSAFDRKQEKEYTNLSPGSYIFRVKARNNLGNESTVFAYRFTLLPPWYRTVWAYLCYTLIIAVLAFRLYRYQQRKFRAQQQRHEEEQRRLQYLHQLEMDKAEKELITLRNAKLEAEIQSKNTELASAAMHLVQKSDVLLKIKEQMSKLKDGVPAADNAADLKKILKTLNEENKIEEQWQQFATHFDVVHRDFLTTLKRAHPALTPNEQKLCAYLKMNLSTKEIAQLMNISTRGVEISRYRLRKKLGVPTGMHLFNFLDSVV